MMYLTRQLKYSTLSHAINSDGNDKLLIVNIGGRNQAKGNQRIKGSPLNRLVASAMILFTLTSNFF